MIKNHCRYKHAVRNLCALSVPAAPKKRQKKEKREKDEIGLLCCAARRLQRRRTPTGRRRLFRLAAALHTEGDASLVDKTLPFKMSYRPFDKEIILLRSSRSRGKTPYEMSSADGRIAVGKNERDGCNLAAGKRLHWFLVDF